MGDSGEDQEGVQAFLRDLIDRYGVEGLTERFRAAINEAESGRVVGPGIVAAADWLKSVETEPVRAFTGGAMFTATATLTVGGVVGQAIEGVVTDNTGSTDNLVISVHEAAHVVSVLPTEMQVIAQIRDMFFYLLSAWDAVHQVEVVPFVLLFALAIVVIRIRLKQ